MALQIAYPDSGKYRSKTVLPPAYGLSAISGTLPPAYGLNETTFDFGFPSALDSRITFTRSTTALRTNSLGTAVSTAIDVARANANQDYNPSTLAARGFLIEAGATNAIRNPRAEGAVAGSPGTLPTNWVTSLNGLTQTIVGAGTSNGIPYIDIRFNGTTTGAGSTQIKPDGNASVSGASSSQSWTPSAWVAVVGGTTTNLSSMDLMVGEYSAGPTFLRNTQAATSILAGGATLTRVSGGITTGASTTILEPFIRLVVTGAVAVDITLRIGAPQLEQNAFATSLILPPVASPAATARGADQASITNLASIGYSQTVGFVYAEFELQGVGSSNSRRVFSFNDSTASNRIMMYVADGVTDLIRFQVSSGGASQADVSSGVAAAANTLCKAAVSWSAGVFRISVNGAAAVEDLAGTVPTVSRLQIGLEGGSDHLGGWIPKLQYGPQLLTSAQLAALTA